MRVALAGQGALGRALFDGVRASRHALVAVVTHRRGVQAWLDPVRAAARRHDVPARRLRDRDDNEALRDVDLLLCGDFGLILGAGALGAPRIGAVNVHWSLLPLHRGPDPAAAAILAGDARSGVSFHRMEARVDAGPLLDQVAFDLGPRDTSARVYHRAARIAGERIAEVLDRIEEGGVGGAPMDVAAGSYRRRLRRSELEVGWNADAATIDRLVRAATSPAAWFRHGGVTVCLSEVEPLRRTAPAAPGTLLALGPPVVAAGIGAVRVLRAYTTRPMPLPWPGLRRLQVGRPLA